MGKKYLRIHTCPQSPIYLVFMLHQLSSFYPYVGSLPWKCLNMLQQDNAPMHNRRAMSTWLVRMLSGLYTSLTPTPLNSYGSTASSAVSDLTNALVVEWTLTPTATFHKSSEKIFSLLHDWR